MRLSEVPVGTAAVVRSVRPGTHGEGRRLEDVGFVVGTRIRVERRAPLGDPTIFEVRGTRLALRRSGADLVEVEPVATADPVPPDLAAALADTPTADVGDGADG
ncbi:MAG: FeoA family protein [Acidimicrobiales bacterium]